MNQVRGEGGAQRLYESLTYKVRVKNTTMVVLATVDTGAQCSAIRADVFQALNPAPVVVGTEEKEKPDMRGVSGEPLRVLGRCRLCIYAGGITTTVEL